MDKKIRVAILDDHLSSVEGHAALIEKDPQIKVVSKMSYGEELEPTLEKNLIDVLLLDVSVPNSEENKDPYPILNMIPKLLQTYPNLNILVISMFVERGIIRAVMEAGANGYLLKDDKAMLKNLASVVRTVAGDGIQFSQAAYDLYSKSLSAHDETKLTPRQLEALSLCVAYPDLTLAEIALKMKIKNSTVRNLLSKAYIELKVQSRTAATARARELGLITPYPSEAPKK